MSSRFVGGVQAGAELCSLVPHEVAYTSLIFSLLLFFFSSLFHPVFPVFLFMPICSDPLLSSSLIFFLFLFFLSFQIHAKYSNPPLSSPLIFFHANIQSCYSFLLSYFRPLSSSVFLFMPKYNHPLFHPFLFFLFSSSVFRFMPICTYPLLSSSLISFLFLLL